MFSDDKVPVCVPQSIGKYAESYGRQTEGSIADSGACRLTFLPVCRTKENAVSYFLRSASIARAVMANTSYFSQSPYLMWSSNQDLMLVGFTFTWTCTVFSFDCDPKIGSMLSLILAISIPFLLAIYI